MHDAQMIGAYSMTGSVGAMYRVHNNPTTRIGFATNPSFVTASDDNTLNDPAFGYLRLCCSLARIASSWI
jgi:hypothetical protein